MPTVTWIFLILAGLGLGFMLYVLVQFHRESKGRKPGHGRAGHLNAEIAAKRRVVDISSKQSLPNDYEKTATTEWNDGNREVRIGSSNGDLFVRRIRASAKPKFDISRGSGSSKAG